MTTWIRTILPISAIFALRMLGLFMLIPVFTIYAQHLIGATPILIGTALGVYGLSQSILQLPMGILSDRYGRKIVIFIGLLLFISGSIYGALTNSILGMIVARTLQGAGAIGGVLMALLADLTTEKERTMAMAIIGATIGISFGIAMIISPMLAHYYNLHGIFYLTSILAIIGILLLCYVVPAPNKVAYQKSEVYWLRLKNNCINVALQRLNFGIFCQHLILTATFYNLPLLLHKQISLGNLQQLWHFYAIIMLLAFLIMIPIIIYSEKNNLVKCSFLLSIVISCLTQFSLLFFYDHWVYLCALMLLYFIAFNILEAMLPSLISKQADINSKGTAMGIYSSSQFFGIFIGGLLAGILYGYGGNVAIFCLNAIVALLWLIVAWRMNVVQKTS